MRHRSVVTYPAALIVPVRQAKGAVDSRMSQGRAQVLGTAVMLATLGWALAALI